MYTRDGLALRITQEVSKLAATNSQMLLVPMDIVQTTEDALEILKQVPAFFARRETPPHPTAEGVGFMCIEPSQLLHLDACSMADHAPGQFCPVTTVPGRTCRVSALLGLFYDTFLLSVDGGSAGVRIVLVVLHRSGRWTSQRGDPVASLDPLVAQLEARAVTHHESDANYYLADLRNGWQLLLHGQFAQVCRLIRPGYTYNVDVDHQRGGIVLHY